MSQLAETKEVIVKNYDKIDRMIAWEQGELSDKETLKLFQELIDSREVWQLQGRYGRFAHALLEAGYCKRKAV